MKKIVLNLVLLVLTSTLIAQTQAGKITYFFNRSVDVDLGDNMPEEQKTAMKEMISKQFKKTFELEFSGVESVYSEKAELQKETNSNVRIMIVGGPSGKLYKSTKDKKFIRSDESLGKRFLITDELEKPEWELVDSTKLIKKYLCYKAKYVREINRNDSIVNIPVTAWYAPDIPLNTGPEKFWGLPGLILEIQQGKVSITL